MPGSTPGETAQLALDLHRTDDFAGNIALTMELAGATPVLKLQLEASEPTGALLDRLLARTDRPPLALSVNGTGPLADRHGRVSASAGTLARIDADVTLGVKVYCTVLGVSGTAAMALLLPAEFAPLIGDQLTLSLHGVLGERVVLDALSIGIAAGTLTADATYGGADKAITAHLRANVPELSTPAGLLGQSAQWLRHPSPPRSPARCPAPGSR